MSRRNRGRPNPHRPRPPSPDRGKEELKLKESDEHMIGSLDHLMHVAAADVYGWREFVHKLNHEPKALTAEELNLVVKLARLSAIYVTGKLINRGI